MSSTTCRALVRAPRTHFGRFVPPVSAIIIRSNLFVSAFIFFALLGRDAQAIEISIASITIMPDTTASGVYTDPGEGTSAWDSEITTISAGGSAPSKVGASASAEIRAAFNGSTIAPQSSAATFTATMHFQVTVEVVNDDPLNNPVYLVSLGNNLSGVAAAGGKSSTQGTFNWQSAVTHNAETDTSHNGGVTPAGGYGPFSETGSGGLGKATGTAFFTVEFDDTVTVSAQPNGSLAVLAGLNTGLNPALGVLQNYPSGAGHTDPSIDGEFLTFTATVLSAPEPGTAVLLGAGVVIFGFASASKSWGSQRNSRRRLIQS